MNTDKHVIFLYKFTILNPLHPYVIQCIILAHLCFDIIDNSRGLLFGHPE
jgi:hypothetical protein